MDTNFISVVTVDDGGTDDIDVPINEDDIQNKLQNNRIYDCSYCVQGIRKIKFLHIFNLFVIVFVASLLGVVVYIIGHLIFDQDEPSPYALCWRSAVYENQLFDWTHLYPLEKNEWATFRFACDRYQFCGLEVLTNTKYYYDGAKPMSLQLCTYPWLNGTLYASKGTTLHNPKHEGEYECHLIFKQVQRRWTLYYAEYLCVVKGSCDDIPLSVDDISWDPEAVVRTILTANDTWGSSDSVDPFPHTTNQYDLKRKQNQINETKTNSKCQICGLC
eukprot:80274_1